MSDARTPLDWDLRVPTSEQLRAWMAPVHIAFAEPTSGPMGDDWAKLMDPDRWLGAFDSPGAEEPVGSAAALSRRLTVPGGEIAVAAVTGVGVRPDHTRRGALTALMRRQLDDIRAAGEPVAILWASEGAIYQRYGYGLATFDGHIDGERARLAFRPGPAPQGRVRLVTEEESLELFPPVYDVLRAVTPGAITRPDDWWRIASLADPEYSRQGMSERYRVVYEVDGKAEGFATYRVKEDWSPTGPTAVMQVGDVVPSTPRALRMLWRYLLDVDLVKTVKASHVAVPNPLQHLLTEPRALGFSVADGLWARLVDLPAALQARRYATADSLVLEVSDPFCAWNEGTWRISTAGEPGASQATVEATTAVADLSLDTTDLAAAYLGGSRLHNLATVGRVEERTPGALARLDRLFTTGREPWCGSMF